MRAVRAAAVLLLAALLATLLGGVPLAAAVDDPPVPSPAVSALVDPPLAVTGTSADGWTVYRLADGRLPEPVPAGTLFRGEVHLRVAGRERVVRLLVPPSARGAAPLLVVLHGLYQTVAATERTQRWAPLARRSGVVLAYGVGTAASWDAGTCCGRAAATHVDDVGYLDRVVAVASALHPVDPRRRYLTGFSNGAMMAYRYACERRAEVAAVLSVAGTVTARCRGRSDVAVLEVHGRADRTVPLGGLAWSGTLGSPLPPVSATARSFGPTVGATLLDGFGHAWPTVRKGGYDATGRGWAFLATHPRRG